MDKLIMTSMSVDELTKAIKVVVSECIKENHCSALEEKWFTTKEVAGFLKVTTATIGNWVKEGRLQKHQIGNRPRFKYTEVMDNMIHFRKYQF